MDPETETTETELEVIEKEIPPFRFYIFQHFTNKNRTRYFMVTWPWYDSKTNLLSEVHILELSANPPIKHVFTSEEAFDMIDKGSLVEWTPKTKQSDAWWRKQKTVHNRSSFQNE